MTIRTTGVRELVVDLERMRVLMRDPDLITEPLDKLMARNAPVRTGFLRSSTYHRHTVAGASAPYAGWVEEMGDKYAYATQSIKEFKMNRYADKIVEPF